VWPNPFSCFSFSRPNGSEHSPAESGIPHQRRVGEGFQLEVRHYAIQPQNGFRIDLDEIRDLIDARIRFVLVNSLHNPTGTVFSDAEIENLHDVWTNRGVQFIVDQVYHLAEQPRRI
jgi:histidinol-phosphate/aromatic aminotransferase/cobyric acid decarboxylase-like protein